MKNNKVFKRRLASAAWGSLLIWWGIVLMVDPLTIAIGAIGTGVIFIAVNLILSLRGLATKVVNTELGILAIVWGVLDQVRHMLALPASLSFGSLLIVLGAAMVFFPLLFPSATEPNRGSV